jgi:hypothetical protein
MMGRAAGVAAAVATLCVASGVAPPTAAAYPGECGAWGARVQGAPIFFNATDRTGDYLWHDDAGFHLRVTHRGAGREDFAGIITSPTPMHLSPVQLEGYDRADLSPDGRRIDFIFADHGYVDGVDFTTECADHLTVGPLTVNDYPLPSNRVFLGVRRVNPDHVPFDIERFEV